LRIRLTGKETHKRGGENGTRQDRKLHSSDVDSVLALRRGVVPGATALLPLRATSTAARALQTTRPRRSRYTNELHTRARPTLFLVPSRANKPTKRTAGRRQGCSVLLRQSLKLTTALAKGSLTSQRLWFCRAEV